MSEIAAALIKDVPRYDPCNCGGATVPDGHLVTYPDVLAALSAALDGVDERAKWIVERLRAMPIRGGLHGITTASHAADLITTLLTANAALRAERDEHRRNWERAFNANTVLEERLTAAEAKVEKLRGALQIARVHVANNAEGWSVSRGAARDDLTIVDAALTTEEGHE